MRAEEIAHFEESCVSRALVGVMAGGIRPDSHQKRMAGRMTALSARWIELKKPIPADAMVIRLST